MTTQPNAPLSVAHERDDGAVRAFLATVSRRVLAVAALRAIGAAALVAFGGAAALAWGISAETVAVTTIVAAVVVAVAIFHAGRPRGTARIAERIEHDVPAFRNLLVACEELLRHPARAKLDIRADLFSDAAIGIGRLDVRRLVPVRSAVLAAAVVVALALVANIVAIRSQGDARRWLATVTAKGPVIFSIATTVTPPAYSGLPAVSTSNADRVDVLQGSRVYLTVEASAATLVAAGASTETVARDAHGRFVLDVAVNADGFLALEPRDAAGHTGPRRLVTLTARPDAPPRVTIRKPAKDLYVANADQKIDVDVTAEDDLAVHSLQVKYTKVSGSGENFTFKEGDLPLQVSTNQATSWSGHGTFALDALALEPGDLVVYRGVATDNRPGAPAAESDAFIIEILAPGESAADGFAVDDTPEKYKLSQQMVIVKTEQLISKKGALPTAEFADQAMDIAAEQRKVRAEFVFMMGGELSDATADSDPTMLHEETEAEGEADIAAGRMQNRGRQDVILAVRRMSDAATSLVAPDVATALTQERAALDALQRAFTKSRYILRTFTVQERIDPARRLGGNLSSAQPARMTLAETPVNATLAELQRTLADLGALATRPAFGPSDAAEASRLAERLLRLDPQSAELTAVASALGRMATGIADGASGATLRSQIDDITVGIAKVAAAQLPRGAEAGQTPEGARLAGAVADALRGKGGLPR